MPILADIAIWANEAAAPDWRRGEKSVVRLRAAVAVVVMVVVVVLLVVAVVVVAVVAATYSH